MWKNSLKNVESDNNKILYETLLDFFLQRNGTYFLNKPRVCVYIYIYEIMLQGKSIKFIINIWKSCILLNYATNQSFIYSPTDAFPNSVYCRIVQQTYTNKDPIYANHTTTVLTTHRCILMDYFNNCNFSEHELIRSLMVV